MINLSIHETVRGVYLFHDGSLIAKFDQETKRWKPQTLSGYGIVSMINSRASKGDELCFNCKGLKKVAIPELFDVHYITCPTCNGHGVLNMHRQIPMQLFNDVNNEAF